MASKKNVTPKPLPVHVQESEGITPASTPAVQVPEKKLFLDANNLYYASIRNVSFGALVATAAARVKRGDLVADDSGDKLVVKADRKLFESLDWEAFKYRVENSEVSFAGVAGEFQTVAEQIVFLKSNNIGVDFSETDAYLAQFRDGMAKGATGNISKAELKELILTAHKALSAAHETVAKRLKEQILEAGGTQESIDCLTGSVNDVRHKLVDMRNKLKSVSEALGAVNGVLNFTPTPRKARDPHSPIPSTPRGHARNERRPSFADQD